jgi:hypothetical protein
MYVDADGTSSVLCNKSVATREGEQLRPQSPPHWLHFLVNYLPCLKNMKPDVCASHEIDRLKSHELYM